MLTRHSTCRLNLFRNYHTKSPHDQSILHENYDLLILIRAAFLRNFLSLSLVYSWMVYLLFLVHMEMFVISRKVGVFIYHSLQRRAAQDKRPP